MLELKSKAESELRGAIGSLKPEEAAVLALLRDRLAKEFAKVRAFIQTSAVQQTASQGCLEF